MGRCLWILALWPWVANCGGLGNSLEGSINEIFSLEFETVTISRIGCFFTIAYTRSGSLGTQSPCILTIDTTDLHIVEDTPVFKGENRADDFKDAVEISRTDLLMRTFPDVKTGQMEFKEFAKKAGKEVRGEFSVDFVDGHDMNGKFRATLQVPDLSATCEPEEEE